MSDRSFEEVWQDIKSLEGKDVFTLRRCHKNHIVKVDEEGMERLSASKVKSSNINKKIFKKVWKRLVEYRKFDKPSHNFTYACIARLPEVECSPKDRPLGLYLRQQNTHPLGEVKEYTE